MKSAIALVLLGLIVAACNGENFSNDNSTTKSSSTPAPAPAPAATGITTTPTPAPTSSGLNSCQAQSVSNLAGRIVAQLANNLTVSGLQDNGPSLTINDSFSCPNGGTVTVSAMTSLTLNLGFPSSSLSLTGGATVTFSGCAIQACTGVPAVTINGTAQISSVHVNATGDETTGAFNGTGGGTLAGSLQVSMGGAQLSCQLSLTNSDSGSGTVILSPLSASGTDTITASGSVCGIGVNTSIQNAAFKI